MPLPNVSLNQLSDPALCAIYQEKESPTASAAAAELLTRHGAIVRHFARKAMYIADRPDSADDALSIVRILALGAFGNYQPRFGTAVATHLYYVLSFRLRRSCAYEMPIRIPNALRAVRGRLLYGATEVIGASTVSQGGEPADHEIACQLPGLLATMVQLCPSDSISENPEDAICDRLIFRQALAKLHPVHRELLSRVYEDGQRNGEAGEAFGLSYDQVSQRLVMAKRRLRKLVAALE